MIEGSTIGSQRYQLLYWTKDLYCGGSKTLET